MVECTRLESEQTVKGLGSSNLPLSVGSWGGTAPQPPPRAHPRPHARGSWWFLAAVVAIVGVPAAGNGGEPVSLNGIVTSYSSGRPLVNAAIVVTSETGDRMTAKTDSRGRYAALGMAAGAIRIDVSVDGFDSETSTCYVAAGASARQDFQLSPQLHTIASVHVHAPPAFHCSVDPDTVDRYTLH